MHDDDDEVIARIPVRLQRPADGTPLHLWQYPLRPRWRPYDTDSLEHARVRPKHQQVELQLKAEQSSATYDEESQSPLTHITLTSTTTPAKTSYGIGMLRRDDEGDRVLCLVPLAGSVQLRPSFADVDEHEKREQNAAASRVAGDDLPGEPAADGDDSLRGAGAGAASSSLMPVFRPAQTEKEIEARRNSHAYMVEQQEAEEWSAATLFGANSEESHTVRERMFAATEPAGPPRLVDVPMPQAAGEAYF